MQTLQAELQNQRTAIPRDAEADDLGEEAMINALEALGYIE